MNREDRLLNRSEIIRMAREASNNASGLYEESSDLVMLYLDELERFAALIALRVAAAAKAEEREACAKVCLDMQNGWASDDHLQCGFAIRARGETK